MPDGINNKKQDIKLPNIANNFAAKLGSTNNAKNDSIFESFAREYDLDANNEISEKELLKFVKTKLAQNNSNKTGPVIDNIKYNEISDNQLLKDLYEKINGGETVLDAGKFKTELEWLIDENGFVRH